MTNALVTDALSVTEESEMFHQELQGDGVNQEKNQKKLGWPYSPFDCPKNRKKK